ncbi:helix-turn-helix transcriptional regulator [Marivita geojedonensis]|uniref:AlpA family transcriptional regulator n=1 Tax=Marivita geojedonensis TaxID=1123756 RepID=A0A1X4NCX2_9RHOB|nr:hypothetical protein MGEO_18815 [Marivita geojedonensis]
MAKEQTFLTVSQVAARYGVHRASVWRWHRDLTDFPRAIRLAPGTVRWRLSDLQSWENNQVESA